MRGPTAKDSITVTTTTATAAAAAERSWWRLGRDGWIAVIRSTLREFKEDQIQLLAAAVTLRIVLALVPSLIAAVAIAAQFVSSDQITELVASAEEFIPPESQEFVTDQLNSILAELQRGEVGVIGVLAGIFAASGAAIAIITALNNAFEVVETRKFVQLRLVSLAVVGALVLALAGMFASLVMGPTLIAGFVPDSVLDSPVRYLITIGRYLSAFLLLILFFGFLFWFAPNREERPPLRLLTPGAAFGVLGWIVLSYLFSLYVGIAGGYSATYGAAAGIVVLLVWLQYSFTVLLTGGELNHEIERHLDGLAAVPVDGHTDADDDGRARTIDLDAVTEDMPRHAGLLAASGNGSDPPAEEVSEPVATPRLVGAAAGTSGAGVAALVWRLTQNRG